MADLAYRAATTALLKRWLSWEMDDIQALLIDTELYEPDQINDSTLSDIPAGAVLMTRPLLGRRVVNGWARADPMIFGNVMHGKPGAIVLMMVPTGSQELPLLIAYIDSLDGFPTEANGSDIRITWNRDGLFRLLVEFESAEATIGQNLIPDEDDVDDDELLLWLKEWHEN
ncbi:MAG: hypothetical protein KAJ19_13555 [Gammaproteobacteria bacterium]|nr:hypothetical protein [Gammaproteobacteria bacterium]